MCPREFKMINEIGFGVNQTGIAKMQTRNIYGVVVLFKP